MGSVVNDEVTDHTEYRSKSFLTSGKRQTPDFYCPDKYWPDHCEKVTDPKQRKKKNF